MEYRIADTFTYKRNAGRDSEDVLEKTTLEGLFDFYFVQPAKLKKKRDALNEKLKKAGKPPLKG